MTKRKMFRNFFLRKVVRLSKKMYTKFLLKKTIHHWIRLFSSLIIYNSLKNICDSTLQNITNFISMTEGAHRDLINSKEKSFLDRYQFQIDTKFSNKDYIFPGEVHSLSNQTKPIPKLQKVHWRIMHDIRDRVQDIRESNILYLEQRRESLMLRQICRQKPSFYRQLFSFIYPFLLKVFFFQRKIPSLLSRYNVVNSIIINSKRYSLIPMLQSFNPILIMIGKLISLGCLEPQIFENMRNLKKYVNSVTINNEFYRPRLIMNTRVGIISLTCYLDSEEQESDDLLLLDNSGFSQFFEDIYLYQSQECNKEPHNMIDIEGLKTIIKGKSLEGFEYICYEEPIINSWYRELCTIEKFSL